MSTHRASGSDTPRESELHLVQQLVARERLSLDLCARGRTSFLSHVGAVPRLVPGPWIAHRDLIYALALANLAPAQRTALARAVLVEHDREFGVGRLLLRTLPSGLPLGGSSLRLQPRGGPACLYTWAVGETAASTPCEWLLLRAEPGWSQPEPAKPLAAHALETLHALEASVVILVATAADARLVADRCLQRVPFTAHPRFLPHLTHEPGTAATAARASTGPNAPRVRLWPHDAVAAPGFWSAGTRTTSGARDRSQRPGRGTASTSSSALSLTPTATPGEPGAVLMIDAPESVRRQVEAWHAAHPDARRIEIACARCPGRVDRAGLSALWHACERPQVLLRGDPEWAGDARRFLHELGARVEAQAQGTQLPLL